MKKPYVTEDPIASVKKEARKAGGTTYQKIPKPAVPRVTQTKKQLSDTVEASIKSHVVGPAVKSRMPRTAPHLKGNLDQMDKQRKNSRISSLANVVEMKTGRLQMLLRKLIS